MVPLVIDEQKIFSFKFWFQDQIQTGMHFQNELYCHIKTVDINQRSQLYQRVCKLTQQGIGLIITCSAKECSLWGSLRDETVKQLLLNPTAFKLSDFTDRIRVDTSPSGAKSETP